MADLLDQAIDVARGLPKSTQDEIARIVLSLAGCDEARISLTAEEQAAIGRSRAAAARGEFATDEQVSALWAKHGF